MIGERLKLARNRAGYTLRDLSNEANNIVSHNMIAKYERDESMPGSKVLIELSKILNVSVSWLLNPQKVEIVGEIEFRKAASTRKREKEAVKAEVLDLAERYIAIEKIANNHVDSWQLPMERVSVNSLSDAVDAASELRKVWKLGHEPIANLTELAEEHGLKVCLHDLPEKVSGLAAQVKRQDKSSMITIVVNKNHTLERRRHTLAHEIGHLILDVNAECDEEKAVDSFAGAFLLPNSAFREMGQSRRWITYPEIKSIKRLFRVSAMSVVVRSVQAGVLIPKSMGPCIGKYKLNRRAEPDAIEPDGMTFEAPKRFSRLVYRSLSEDLISPSRASELLKISINELREEMAAPDANFDK